MSIHEAAERYRKWREWCHKERASGFAGLLWPYDGATEDAVAIANAFTDPSPITPEALASRGFVEQGEDSWQRNCQDADLDVYFSGDVPHVNVDDGDRVYLPNITTLTQLDHLLAALTPRDKN